ncbi:MAG: PIG-L family deacetylase [Gemmatimonadota bacterium]
MIHKRCERQVARRVLQRLTLLQPLRLLLIGAVGSVCLPPLAAAQASVDPEHGVIKVALALRSLGSVKRVLVIGAHPDDEDTSLLTLMERGLGADAAYLSLNRGEGGQNLIGPQLGVGLGLIRTEELLAARSLDGAEQFFTRAYDFGYSKSAGETFEFWPRDSLLADVVSVVRRFRPQVIVSVFSGTRRDGHGQHQVAGLLAQEAFEISGDPTRFPEQLAQGLEPWMPLKLYRSTRFDRAATTLEIQTGIFDPLYGRSYHQIAMVGRSKHRSQDMGRIEELGPRTARVQLLKSRVGPVPAVETSIFAGVDTTLTGLLGQLPSAAREGLASELAAYQEHLDQSRAVLSQWQPSRSAPYLGQALASLRRVKELAQRLGAGAADLGFVLDLQRSKLEAALSAASGIVVDAFAGDDLLAAGQTVEVEVLIWNGGDAGVELAGVSLRTGDGWRVEPLDPVASLVPAGSMTRRRFEVTVPADAEAGRPYFLREARAGAVYIWTDDATIRGLPFDPPLIAADVQLRVEGQAVSESAEVVNRFADQARGEVRRPLRVVPAVGVEIEPSTSVWPLDRTEPAAFAVSVRGEVPGGVSGSLTLEAPAGWRVTAEDRRFRLPAPGSAATVEFRVEPPPDLATGSYEFEAVAVAEDGRRYTTGYAIIDHPHIRRQVLFKEARARIEAFHLELAERRMRVGYIPGAGDAVAEAIRAMKIDVEVLDDRAIASADLSVYDAIVVGIRAYETNSALLENNERLLGWVHAGGTLIVQYQQYRFFNGDYAPYSMSARRPHDRVTDEKAPVRLLDPDHAAFNHPNRISEADFEAWVQERGLYFPYEWDPSYTPLLETADLGEAPKRGALLIAPVGSGLYVYTGLSFFRQLPAGVPGAYRLLANLLSLRYDLAF